MASLNVAEVSSGLAAAMSVLALAPKLGQIGPTSQMGLTLDFKRPVSVHSGSPSKNVLKLILPRPKFVPFRHTQSTSGLLVTLATCKH